MSINHIFNNKGQNIIEYALILGVVVLALSAMQTYIKRGIQAGIKVAADELGQQEDAEETDPLKGTMADAKIRNQTGSREDIELFAGGSQRVDIDKASTNTGQAEYWSWEE